MITISSNFINFFTCVKFASIFFSVCHILSISAVSSAVYYGEASLVRCVSTLADMRCARCAIIISPTTITTTTTTTKSTENTLFSFIRAPQSIHANVYSGMHAVGSGKQVGKLSIHFVCSASNRIFFGEQALLCCTMYTKRTMRPRGRERSCQSWLN